MGRKTKTTVPQEPVQLEQLLSIPDVMRMLGLGRDTIYRLIREEGLPSLKIGSRRVVVPSSLAAWIKRREQLTLTGTSDPVNISTGEMQ